MPLLIVPFRVRPTRSRYGVHRREPLDENLELLPVGAELEALPGEPEAPPRPAQAAVGVRSLALGAGAIVLTAALPSAAWAPAPSVLDLLGVLLLPLVATTSLLPVATAGLGLRLGPVEVGEAIALPVERAGRLLLASLPAQGLALAFAPREVARLAARRARAVAEIEEVLASLHELRVQVGILALAGENAPVQQRLVGLRLRIRALQEVESQSPGP